MQLSPAQFNGLVTSDSPEVAEKAGAVDVIHRHRKGFQEENRSSPRSPVAESTLVYFEIVEPGGKLGAPVRAELRDASQSGVALLSPLSMVNGAKFVLHVETPAGKPLSVRCIVRNCRPADTHTFRVGAEFEDLLKPAPAFPRSLFPPKSGRLFARFAATGRAVVPAVSAVLCVAALALWVRSYWRQDSLAAVHVTATPYDGEEQFTSVHSNLGEIGLAIRSREFYSLPVPYTGRSEPWRREAEPAGREKLVGNVPGVASVMGFAFGTSDSGNVKAGDGSWTVTRQYRLALPHWFVVLLLALPPLSWWRGTRRQRLWA